MSKKSSYLLNKMIITRELIHVFILSLTILEQFIPTVLYYLSSTNFAANIDGYKSKLLSNRQQPMFLGDHTTF